MIKSRYLLLLAVVFICLISTIEAAKKKTKKKSSKKVKSKYWKFYNWNKYGKATVGKGSNFEKDWGIPEHGGWLWNWKGADNFKNVAVRDPSGKKKDLMLRVEYPKGSRNPEVNPIGGLGFKAHPIAIDQKVKTVIFQYSVYFPKGFKFVRGTPDVKHKHIMLLFIVHYFQVVSFLVSMVVMAAVQEVLIQSNVLPLGMFNLIYKVIK